MLNIGNYELKRRILTKEIEEQTIILREPLEAFYLLPSGEIAENRKAACDKLNCCSRHFNVLVKKGIVEKTLKSKQYQSTIKNIKEYEQ
jgi:hypothetical protein